MGVLKQRLDSIRFTADGLVPLQVDLGCLSSREALLGIPQRDLGGGCRGNVAEAYSRVKTKVSRNLEAPSRSSSGKAGQIKLVGDDTWYSIRYRIRCSIRYCIQYSILHIVYDIVYVYNIVYDLLYAISYTISYTTLHVSCLEGCKPAGEGL